VVKGLRLDSSAASCASYDTQLHQHTRSLISEHKSSTVPVQARDSLLTLACSGNLWGCDTWKPHCKQWAQAERSYHKEVAQNEMVLILHERLAVIKSSCRNMLTDIALHRANVKVILSYKDVLEAGTILEMQYKTSCQCQSYMSA